MKNISIGYFADGPWSHEAFKLLINDSTINILFIIPRTDTKDKTLREYALKYGIDYLEGIKINSDEFINKSKQYNCDLFVSMSFNQIFKKEIINIPKLKTINCHAGKLPFYRGRNILNWVLINDEKEFGITVHYIDEGIDTGDIILQRVFTISDNDDYSSLLKIAYKECAKILYDSIKLIQNEQVKRIKQEDVNGVGFYCGQRGAGDEIMEWNQTSRDIFNFIRAISYPGPMARTRCRGVELKISSAKLINNAPSYKSIVGQVVGKSDRNIIVKTKDSTIEITNYEYEGVIRMGDRLK